MRRVLFTLLLWVALQPVSAQQSDQAQPTLIDADQLVYDERTQTSVFKGNVVLTRGSLIIRADELELKQLPSGEQMGLASSSGNNRVFVRQQREGLNEHIEGTARRAEYNGPEQRITFVGNAIVRRLICEQPSDEIRGDRVVYNQRTETYSAVAANGEQRVRTVIQPRQASSAPSPSGQCPPEQREGPALQPSNEARQ